MEILKKLLDLISEFLVNRKAQQFEREEMKRLEVEQEIKTKKQLQRRKNETIKPPKKGDFFNDDSW
jgi:hypothetical protein